jgi:hypothetical protein
LALHPVDHRDHLSPLVAQVTALIDKYFEKEVEADEGLIGAVKTIPPSTRASIKVPSLAADFVSQTL